MNFSIVPRQVVLAIATAVLMAGCGGGGGGELGSGSGIGTDGGTGTGGDVGVAGGKGRAGTLIGHTISSTDFHGDAPDHTTVLGPLDTVAGDGVELTNEFFGAFATVDFSGTSIRITAANDQPFGWFEVLRFADTNGTISPIVSVTIDPATDYAGFSASLLNFTADHIDVTLTGLPGQRGQQILLNIVFAAP